MILNTFWKHIQREKVSQYKVTPAQGAHFWLHFQHTTSQGSLKHGLKIGFWRKHFRQKPILNPRFGVHIISSSVSVIFFPYRYKILSWSTIWTASTASPASALLFHRLPDSSSVVFSAQGQRTTQTPRSTRGYYSHVIAQSWNNTCIQYI